MKIIILWISCLTALANHAACDSEQHRQFDFWLGEWRVTTADGKQVGTNRISKDLNGCILREEYSTVAGFVGESFNLFDQSRNQWHQTWVDNQGRLLQLDGVWDGESMTLKGSGIGPAGEALIHRIRWTPKQNQVVQHWQATADQGKTWQDVFYGIYSPVKP